MAAVALIGELQQVVVAQCALDREVPLIHIGRPALFLEGEGRDSGGQIACEILIDRRQRNYREDVDTRNELRHELARVDGVHAIGERRPDGGELQLDELHV